MNTDIVPFDFEGSPVRTVMHEGTPYFVAADACRILAVTNPTLALRAIPDPEKAQVSLTLNNFKGEKSVNLVTEGGLFRLIFKSRKPAAERFTSHVVNVILPAIRRTGTYVDSNSDLARAAATDPEAALALLKQATATADELLARNRRMRADLAELGAANAALTPKADAYDAYFDTDGTCSVREAARHIREMFGLRESELRHRLRHRWHWIEIRSGAATDYARTRGYMVNRVWATEFGLAPMHGRITAKGLQRIQDKIRAEPPGRADSAAWTMSPLC